MSVLGNEAACPQGQSLGIEFAPIARNGCRKVVARKSVTSSPSSAYTFKDEKGAADARVEFIVGNGRVTPLRFIARCRLQVRAAARSARLPNNFRLCLSDIA